MFDPLSRKISRRKVLAAALGAGGVALVSALRPDWVGRACAADSRPSFAPPVTGFRADLIERNEWPEHWETTLAGLDRDPITAHDRFFVRSHFPVPEIDPAEYRLELAGLVRRPLALDLASLRAERQRTTICTIECAGNGRGLMHLPSTSGTQWEYGAVGTARWSGIPLRVLLERAGVEPGAQHVWFEAADHATLPQVPPFVRSVPLAVAKDRVLLALSMNGLHLAARHGAPLRAIVPGWYGMASTKWVTRIRLEAKPSDNHFMARGYRYVAPGGEPSLSPAVEAVRVKSLITSPREGDEVRGPSFEIAGFAWSGAGGIKRVEISAGGGGKWRDAKLAAPLGPFAWRRFTALATTPLRGPITIQARATDTSGATQPVVAPLNAGGYGNNAVHQVRVLVHG